jgi:hypothetical protein
MGRLFWLVLALSACKVQLSDGADGGFRSSDTGVSDSTFDAALGAWGTPTKHSTASDVALSEDDGSLRFDGLEMVFSIANAADGNLKDLYTTSRTSLVDAWTPATKLSLSVTGASDETPRFSADGLTLYFASGRAGGAGDLDIYSVTRLSLAAAWSAPAPVAGPNTAALEKWYSPCGDQYLVIVGGDIAQGAIGAAPTISTELSDATTNETGPYLTPDCLTTYFASPRGAPPIKIYTATRASMTDPWSTPVVFTEFAAIGGDQEDPWMSPDMRIFSFVSNVAGTKDQYIVTR